ncbi:MAG: flavodoxin domain-containing protein, partial [Bacteroidota bacterium]|nr:flavodoxin domain-containing protein [Bacteroidota bacterium]
MLAEPKLKLFQDLVTNATKEELIWISGYVSAFIHNHQPATLPLPNADVASVLSGCTVVYGTESGNSKKVANDLSTKIKKQGLQVKTKSLDQYKTADLAKENCLLVVMSTQGDGEPPAAAKKFYEYLLSNEIKLDKLKYGVLALGDSSYPLFCKAGEDVDERLANLGAQRILAMKKCDTDFEPEASEWIDEILNTALRTASASQPTIVAKTKQASTGKKIYNGKIATRINLNDRGSNKETYHLEITAEDDIHYE